MARRRAEGVKDNREVHEREPRKKDATEGVKTKNGPKEEMKDATEGVKAKYARRSKKGPRGRRSEAGRMRAGSRSHGRPGVATPPVRQTRKTSETAWEGLRGGDLPTCRVRAGAPYE